MTRKEFDCLNIGDEVILTNGYTFCTYTVCGKESSQGNILYEVDGEIFYMPYDKLETKSMHEKMKTIKYKKSITLGELKEKIDKVLTEHPSWEDKMVFMDCLAMCGTFDENGPFVELS